MKKKMKMIKEWDSEWERYSFTKLLRDILQHLCNRFWSTKDCEDLSFWTENETQTYGSIYHLTHYIFDTDIVSDCTHLFEVFD